MARLITKEYFLVSDITKMYLSSLSKPTIHKKESLGEIPQAERSKNRYRVWHRSALPLIGEAIGYLKKPKTCKSIAVYSLKGGTGKTTIAFQLARTMALHNIRVLLIGLDAQASITEILTKNDYPQGIFNVISGESKLQSVIQESEIPNLHFIPENYELSLLDKVLKLKVRKEYVIRQKIIDPLREQYDVIVCDCNPAWTDAVTSTLAATDILIAPMGCDGVSYRAARTFVELLEEFSDSMEHVFENFYIVPTLLENNRISQQILGAYRTEYRNTCSISSLRRAVVVQESNWKGLSLLETAYNTEAYQDFANLYLEINRAMCDEPVGPVEVLKSNQMSVGQ